MTGLHDENGPSAHNGDDYTRLDPDKFPPVRRFSIDHVTAHNNGLYGIYAFDAHDGVISDSYASGSADSGFYVGQCETCGILVTGNVAERNAVGFENANASDSLMVVGNRFSGNRVGMTLISNYQEAFTPQRGNTVVGQPAQRQPRGGLPRAGERLVRRRASASAAASTTRSCATASATTPRRACSSPTPRTSRRRATASPPTSSSPTRSTSPTPPPVRAPASGNCADGTLTTLPADLLATCPGDDDQPTAHAAPRSTVPRGTSFLRVAPPVAQPDMGAWTAQAPPLPETR